MASIVDLAKALAKEKLKSPRFSLLVPDQQRYTALLFQPLGDIEYGKNFGLRNRDRALAEAQFAEFLKIASQKAVDLALCPEYSCPWAAIFKALDSGDRPPAGSLWALGCESLTRKELAAVREKCRDRQIAFICAEPPSKEDGKTFFDPLCYVFITQKSDSQEAVLTVVVQFKCEPMGDKKYLFEPDSLILGDTIYRLRNQDNNSIVLLTLLCSDVLVFGRDGDLNEEMKADHKTLLLHPQLNPEPRHADYARYREYCIRMREKDIICLNWAKHVELRELGSAKVEKWLSTGASAVYTKRWMPNVNDDQVLAAHKRGLYVTYWGQPRGHATFLNFSPLLFTLALSKISQVDAEKPQQVDRIPEVVGLRAWNPESNTFDEQAATKILSAQDGCLGKQIPCELLKAFGSMDQLITSFGDRPLDLERFAALATNRVTRYSWETGYNWPSFESVESLTLGPGESIRRLTFIQDEAQDANDFRARHLKALGQFDRIRARPESYPSHLAEFGDGSDPVNMRRPSCINLRTKKGKVGLFAFDQDVCNEQMAESRYRQLKSLVAGEQVLQSKRRLESENEFKEPVLDQENVLLWYTMVDDKSGKAETHRYPAFLDRAINDPGQPKPAPITGE